MRVMGHPVCTRLNNVRRPIRKTLSTRCGATAVLALVVLAAGAVAASGQAVTFSGQLISFGSGLDYPQGLAVDAKGDVFVADSANDAVKEIVAVNGAIPPVNPTIRTLGSGFSNPAGVAVDASGDVFVADTDNGVVKEIVAVGGSIPANPVIDTLGGSTLVAPSGVALDSAGNLFVADLQIYEIVKAGGYSTVKTIDATYGFSPTALAVDAKENLYDADSDGAVWMLSGPTFGTVRKLGTNFTSLLGVAVDPSGDVFFTQAGTAAVNEFLAVGGTIPATPTVLTIEMGSAYSYVGGVAVNASGQLFVSDIASDKIVKLLNESIVYFGNVFVCPSAQSETSGCTNTLTLSYDVTANGTLGTPKVLTTGQPELDFTLASGNTCVGAVTSGITCTVNVSFTPLAPGSRTGAIEILDGNGNVLATTRLYGNGTGAAVALNVGGSSALTSGFTKPWGSVVDAAGNLFIADVGAGTILKLPAGGSAVQTIATGVNLPMQLALDGSGDLFVGIDGNSTSIVEIPAGCTTSSCQVAIGAGFSSAGGVAVDPHGNVYVSDFDKGTVVEVPPGCRVTSCEITLANRGINGGHAMAIDAAGDLFVAQLGTVGGVVEIPAGCVTQSCQKTIGSGFQGATGVAVDAAGDVFVADFLGHQVYEVTPAGVQTALGSPSYPLGVAVDQTGDVFITGQALTGGKIVGELEELPRSAPASLAFPPTPVGSTSTASVEVQNIGNSQLAESGLTIGAGWVQVAGSGSPADCTKTFVFAPGVVCNLSLSFKPSSTGTFNGAVTLTNNALNAAPGTQQISLSGSGVAASQ
jgi:sugar lactone lactonase YvrE